MSRIVGIPSDGPELTDQISEHFGHCNYFVGIEIDNNEIKKVFSKQNQGHSGCMEPVMDMKQRNVTDMIVGGIGGRPYMGFSQFGIKLHKGIKGTLLDNVKSLMQGTLSFMNEPSCSSNTPGAHQH
jgi:predicted Fe-Mo cluster-binding NifX family protein